MSFFLPNTIFFTPARRTCKLFAVRFWVNAAGTQASNAPMPVQCSAAGAKLQIISIFTVFLSNLSHQRDRAVHYFTKNATLGNLKYTVKKHKVKNNGKIDFGPEKTILITILIG